MQMNKNINLRMESNLAKLNHTKVRTNMFKQQIYVERILAFDA